jgi:signal transduction histidine kinase
MLFDFHRLPTILLLGALVPIFWFLFREDRSLRVRLWLIAWIVVLIRVTVQVFGTRIGLSNQAINAVDLAGLQLAGVVLLVSMTRIFYDPRHRWPFFLMLAVPSFAYAELFSFGYSRAWVYAIDGIVLSVGSVLYLVIYHRRRLEKYMLALCGLVLLITIWGFLRTIHGRPDVGFYTIETTTYALAGFLYWYSNRRFSPGVVLTSIGFFAWAAVFPAFYLLTPLHQQALEALISLSNLPKFWVAIGMIVTLLEDKSRRAQLAEAQERGTREQIQRFFQITSRMLSGADPASLCGEIAAAITEASTFQRAVILVADDQRNLYLGGSSGVDQAAVLLLHEEVRKLTLGKVEHLLNLAGKLGPHSSRVPEELLCGICTLPRSTSYPASPMWISGDKIVVPLRSPSGPLMGCFSLDEPRDVNRVNAEELAAIEMLSADLAISMENSHLQRQLVTSEKLAGLGKLVSGVGHELNNPLTAVLGYAEMLSTSVDDEGTRRSAEVIRREALRMKQIIESLLRFARQTKFERRAVVLPDVLDEVLQLRAYDMRRSGVQVSTAISPNLPGVLVDEGLLKQVFLNIVNNSLEALKPVNGGRITVEATQQDQRVQIRFTDNGTGFSNPDRVFDPFFTTKDPGKGPGLGLSVSYGIIKQHGGEISAYNLHPSGACILIELPIASASDEVLIQNGVAEA